MKTLVTIATLRRFEAACFLKEKLDNKDIDSYFIHLGKVPDKMDFIQVQVDAEKVESAIRIMMEIRDEYGMEIDEIKYERFVRKIIVPTDFSKGSEESIHYAIHLANRMNAEIKLLHVFKNPVSDMKMQSNETFEAYLFDLAREEERKAKRKMVEFIERIKAFMASHKIEGVFVHSVIAMGNIIVTMREICKSYKPDLVVINTLGKGNGKKSVFARVSKELVNDLNIPLFAIPGARPATDFEMLKILYATDFNETDHTSLNKLLVILESFRKHITCIHIDTAHNPANEERIDDLNDYLIKEYGPQEIQCRLIDYSDVSQGIKDFANSGGYNLLSFTIHKRGIFEILFMPNLFKKILQEASLPILIFPSK